MCKKKKEEINPNDRIKRNYAGRQQKKKDGAHFQKGRRIIWKIRGERPMVSHWCGFLAALEILVSAWEWRVTQV